MFSHNRANGLEKRQRYISPSSPGGVTGASLLPTIAGLFSFVNIYMIVKRVTHALTNTELYYLFLHADVEKVGAEL